MIKQDDSRKKTYRASSGQATIRYVFEIPTHVRQLKTVQITGYNSKPVFARDAAAS